MKAVFLLLALAAVASGLPPKRVTNREYPDGSGSSKETDPDKRQSVETFYDRSRRMTHKILYQLDERLQPLSAIYYNAKGVIYQKCSYKLDGQDRIIQEVVYDAKGNLLGTMNYNYGTRNGNSVVIDVDTYDAQGNLVRSGRAGKPPTNRKR